MDVSPAPAPAPAPPHVPTILRPYLAPARLIIDANPGLRFREDQVAKRLFALSKRLAVMERLTR